MTKDFKLWQGQIRGALERLIRLNYPPSPDRLVAESIGVAFRTLMGELYGDYQFAEFLASQAWRQAGLAALVASELLALQQQLDYFDEPDSDRALVASASWQAIVQQTAKVVPLLR